MKVRILLVAVAACAVAGVLARPGQTAPALAERPPRWEYAELQFALPLGAGFPGGGNGAGGPAAPAVLWVTAEGETEAAGWEDLATKLKAPPAKAEGTGAVHRVRVLCRLGADEWELVEWHPAGGGFGNRGTGEAATWVFRRPAL